MSIEIRNVSKQFGDFQALRDVSLDIASGELIAPLGPRAAARPRCCASSRAWRRPMGTIHFSGEDTTDVHVRERNVGFVFQHYALFRHMTVFENVAFGLRVKPRSERPSEAQIKKKVMDLLKLVQLDWLAERYPVAAVWRPAPAHRPGPRPGGGAQGAAARRTLGALDAKVRKELRRWLRRLHDELHVTSIFVTHDQEEALEVADRVVVINQGKIEQSGSPQQVWEHPASPFVYGFWAM